MSSQLEDPIGGPEGAETMLLVESWPKEPWIGKRKQFLDRSSAK